MGRPGVVDLRAALQVDRTLRSEHAYTPHLDDKGSGFCSDACCSAEELASLQA